MTRRVGRTLPALLLILATSTLARADEPRPASLARYFPGKDLAAYVEFDGIDAHAEAWKKTAACKILNDTPAGAMLASVARQLYIVQFKVGEAKFPTFDDVSAISRHLVRSGFAFGINRKVGDPSAKPSSIGLVLRGGAKGPLVTTIEKFLALEGLDANAITKDGGDGSRKISRFGSLDLGVSWWAEGDDLVFALIHVQSAGAMIAAIEGRVPNAVDNPVRKQLASATDGIETVGLAFLDARALPEMPPEAVMFGLDGIQRVDVRWGYRGEALESVTRIVAPAPRKGVLALFDQPTFFAKSFPPLPAGVGSFAITSVDPARSFDRLMEIAKQVDPAIGAATDGLVEMFRAGTGRRLREDILARIGPRVLLADVPTWMLVPTSPFDAMARDMARVPRLSLLVEIRDRAKLLTDLDALANWANEQFPLPKTAKAGDKPAPKLVRRLKNVDGGYEVALSPTYWPLPAGYRPSIVVGENYLSLGTTPDVARQALRSNGELDGPMTRAIANLPDNLTLVSVTDTRNSALPEVLANVPSVIQWWAFAIQSAILGTEVQTVRTPEIAQPADIALAPVQPPAAPAAVLPPAPVQPRAPGAVVVPVPAPAAPVDAIPSTPGLPAFLVRLRLDPDEIPTPEEIRAFLFPATHSLSVDEQGFRFTTREAFPSWNPTGLAPLTIAAALPIFQNLTKPTDGLVKVGKALNDYEEKEGHYPPSALLDKDGKPVLSWRVGILPFLGQQALYDQFHRDEPWDSTHNKALIESMPTAFAHPTGSANSGLTFYRGVIGKGAFFDPEKKDGVSIHQFLDGTANTLVLVEAKEAVPWTKPGTEIPFEGEPMLPKLGGHPSGKFAVLFAFGTVKLIGDSITPELLRAISTRAEGEVVSLDDL